MPGHTHNNKKNKKKNNKVPKYEPEYNEDGTENPRFRTLQTVDKELAGQKFACFSFVSPEDHIKNRNVFYFEEFVRQWNFRNSMAKFHHFLQFVAHKHSLEVSSLMSDFEEFCKDEQQLLVAGIDGDYKTFVEKEEETLKIKYNKAHQFQTSVRSVKFRGAFPSLEEAELRAQALIKEDPDFSTFVGPVGTWLLWHPDIDKMKDVRYLNDEMNRLMHEKKTNDILATQAFDERVLESKQKAIAENKANAEKYGNQITQDIDEHGNLVDLIAKKKSSTSAAAASLFDGEDVVMDKNTDHGLSKLVHNPFK